MESKKRPVEFARRTLANRLGVWQADFGLTRAEEWLLLAEVLQQRAGHALAAERKT